MTILIVMVLCAVPIFILGLFIRQGKGLTLISGYDAAAVAQNPVNKALVSKIAGNMMLRLSIEMALAGTAGYFKLTWLMVAFIAVVVADSLISSIRLSAKTGVRRRGRATNKVTIIVTIVITVATFIVVGVMLYSGAIEPKVNIEDDYFQITGMYGAKIDFADVKSVELIEKNIREIDPNANRDNGYGGVETLKGHFSSKELGKYMLYVYASSSPTVKIVRNGDKDIYISFKDSEKTRTLYQKLLAAVPSD